MKKLIALLLVLTLALPMAAPALAEQTAPEPNGRPVYQVLTMYYWLLGKTEENTPFLDMTMDIMKNGKLLFNDVCFHARTFPDSQIIEQVGGTYSRVGSPYFSEEQFTLRLAALLFAMKYNFGDASQMDDPIDTLRKEMTPIVNAIRAGEPYVFESYVYYINSIYDSDGFPTIDVMGKHIDLYRAEHPEFTE